MLSCGSGGPGQERKCQSCGKTGHIAAKCQGVRPSGVATVNSVAVKVKVKGDLPKAVEEAKKVAGNCLLCNKVHMYDRKFSFGKVPFPTVRFESCDKWKVMWS